MIHYPENFPVRVLRLAVGPRCADGILCGRVKMRRVFLWFWMQEKES